MLWRVGGRGRRRRSGRRGLPSLGGIRAGRRGRSLLHPELLADLERLCLELGERLLAVRVHGEDHAHAAVAQVRVRALLAVHPDRLVVVRDRDGERREVVLLAGGDGVAGRSCQYIYNEW